MLKTEMRNPATTHIDEMSSAEMVQVMNQENLNAAMAVSQVSEAVAEAVDRIYLRMKQGGRLFYVGCGTSGRLGVLDASECPPTYGVSPDLVVGIIAGGDSALRRSSEGAEDSWEAGYAVLESYHITENDTVVGISAAGGAAFVLAAMAYGKERGALTVGITSNAGSKISCAADIAIDVDTGAEVVTGSTRMKAGTAQKLILNMISTGSMVRTGKAYQNLMVDVQQTNEKLHTRAENIVIDAPGVEREKARAAIDAAGGSVKTAITMLLADCDAQEAARRLEKARGHVREAIRLEVL